MRTPKEFTGNTCRFHFLFLLVALLILLGPVPAVSETFSDDFNDPTTYMLPVNPNTKWRQIGTASGDFSAVERSGPTDLCVRLVDTNPESHVAAPNLAADNAQYFDLSAAILEAELRPNNTGAGGIGFGVYDDSGEYFCAVMGPTLVHDGFNWYLVLFDQNEYDEGPSIIDSAEILGFDPGIFHTLRVEILDGMLSATLDGTVTLSGIPRLPIDIAGAGVAVNVLGDYCFDNFSMTAQPDDRHIVFENVQILEDKIADQMLPSWSHDGEMIAYVQDEMDTGPWNIWVKEIPLDLEISEAPPAVRITENSDNVWIFSRSQFSPDQSHVIFTTSGHQIKRVRVVDDPADREPSIPVLSESGRIFYTGQLHPSNNLLFGTTALSSWDEYNIFCVEVTPDGDAAGPVTLLTEFLPGRPVVMGPYYDEEHDRIVFDSMIEIPPDTLLSNIYILEGVQAILDGADPPKDYDDPRLFPIATGPNCQSLAGFSKDGSLVYYCEDVNGVFDLQYVNQNPELPWEVAVCDREGNPSHWELFAVDPNAPAERMRLNYYRPYNQIHGRVSPDGTKLAYGSDNRADGDGYIDGDIWIVTLKVRKYIYSSEGGEIVDGSGTTLEIPPDSMSDDTYVSIQTPFPGEIPSPETLPDGLKNIALARVIEAGTEGILIDELNPPTVTIIYTDAEISGLDEASLKIYVFNEEALPEPAWEALPMPEPPECDDCGVFPDENRVTAQLLHFSAFSISGGKDTDGDGIWDDGNLNNIEGDYPCPNGVTVGCDDNCPETPNPAQQDSDGDLVGEACDNCPDIPNPDQANADGDQLGDICDACPYDPDNDADGDGICGDGDNCPEVPNAGQADADGDLVGDACDNCVNDPNPGQEDCNHNGIGNVCDSIYPGAEEVCDNIDNDCDGSVDEELTQLTTCGVGACAGNTGEETCVAGSWVNDTCDPYAGASAETCDNIDNDCDGSVDEGLTQLTTCGVGACEGNTGIETCTAGVWGGDTCDPYAGASAETCDNVDNDCDGSLADDGVDEGWYGQVTDCGVGECTATGVLTCEAGAQVDTCTEGTPTPEICDGKDNDCNGEVDDGGNALCDDGRDCTTNICSENLQACEYIPIDNDQDGYNICEGPERDCDDNNDIVNPGATEICNGMDDNCDGIEDEGNLDADCDPDDGCYGGIYFDYYCVPEDTLGCVSTQYDTDLDGDTYNTECEGDWVDDPSNDEPGCSTTYTCAANIHPNASEVCEDGVDQDCSGEDAVCEGCDMDSDGHMDHTRIFCNQSIADDCDDSNANIYAGAEEVCDGIDNNCDDDSGNYDDDPATGVDNRDADGDGIDDCSGADKCLGTLPDGVPTVELKPNHYADIDDDWVLEVNDPELAEPVDAISFVDSYGCTCEQILDCKPGQNIGETKHGCSPGTMDIWMQQIDWALECQSLTDYGVLVTQDGVAKSADEDTDLDGVPDIEDADDDNDGIPDIEDVQPEDTENDGKPDWHNKK